MTGEIRDLGKWLKESGCEMAAMESTGVYWKPLYNLFELMELDVMVVNAARMKAVLGRKTDVKDAEWIAELLQPKLDAITSSLESITTPLQRALLRQILDHIDDLSWRVAVLDGMVEQYMAEYAQALEALDAIPGIAKRSAQVILAEIGLDMDRFPSAAHLCSWAGVSPGNHQSAGKRKHGRTNKGNKTLKSMLAQCAKAAAKVKNSYFHAQYQRISARRGKNRATIAVAHSILTVIWHMLKHNVPYRDLGGRLLRRLPPRA